MKYKVLGPHEANLIDHPDLVVVSKPKYDKNDIFWDEEDS